MTMYISNVEAAVPIPGETSRRLRALVTLLAVAGWRFGYRLVTGPQSGAPSGVGTARASGVVTRGYYRWPIKELSLVRRSKGILQAVVGMAKIVATESPATRVQEGSWKGRRMDRAFHGRGDFSYRADLGNSRPIVSM